MQAKKQMKISAATSFNMSVIRILAALCVMIGHNFGFCKLTVFCTQDVFPFIQNIGVVFLFILAGFFMAFSLDQKRGKTIAFSEFMIERYIRLTVTLIPAIALVIMMDLTIKLNKPEVYLFSKAFNFKTLLGNLLFLQDIPNAAHAWGGLPHLARLGPFGHWLWSGGFIWPLAIRCWLCCPVFAKGT